MFAPGAFLSPLHGPGGLSGESGESGLRRKTAPWCRRAGNPHKSFGNKVLARAISAI